MNKILLFIIFTFNYVNSQPKIPVEKWNGKTILLVGAHPDDKNISVDISGFFDLKITSGSKYISQWSSGWEKYLGPDLDNYPKGEKQKVINRLKKRVKFDNGKAIEMFRYYKGIPDGMGRKK